MKNTIALYIRMIVMTVVSFFTVRITLRILGVEDYGIYNVVAGLVSFLGIITATMSSASQRYLSFDLGKSDIYSFQRTFSLLVLVYAVLSLVVFLVGEALGPWIISRFLNIPSSRLSAAQWVYQFSLVSFCLSLISSPYQAAIIAYEKMGVFAFVGLYDSIGKLIVTLLLYLITFDKMIAYAFLLLFISISNFIIQFCYCRKKLPGCEYSFFWDKSYLKEIIGYTGWNLFGAASGTLNTAGVSLVLNMFFGPLINAAKAIADRINSIVVSFSLNFYQAIAPQIIKTYAAEETQQTMMLVYRSSKLSFFLLYIISLPLFCGMPTLLDIWLGSDTVTHDMIVFSRLVLIYSLVNIFEQPITVLMRATGNIKKYQVFVGVVTLSTVPLCVLLFYLGFSAYWSIISLIVVYCIALIIRLYIAKDQVGLSIAYYLKTVIMPIILVVVFSLILLSSVFFLQLNDWLIMLVSLLVALPSVWFLGLRKDERIALLMKMTHFIKK